MKYGKRERMIKSTISDEDMRNKYIVPKVEKSNIQQKITVNERRTSQKAISMGDFNLPLSTLDRSNGSK